jgi:hypothetical protein
VTALPTALSLTNIATNGPINSSDHRDNYTNIQAAINNLLALLGGGTNGQALLSAGAGAVTFGAAASASAERDYKQITASVTGIVAATEAAATTIIAGNTVTYDGTRNKIEFFAPGVLNTNGPLATFVVLRDATVLGQAHASAVAGVTDFAVSFALFDTPTAAAHTYTVKAFGNGNSFDVQAGVGAAGALLPAFLRVVKA